MSVSDIIVSVVVLLAVLVLWILLYDYNTFVVRRVEIRDTRIKKPLRAVVLSDLHNQHYGKSNSRLLRAIDEAKPDCILGVGDFVTANPNVKMDVALDLLEQLQNKYPVYYGMGNHEHRLLLYPKTYGDAGERLLRFLKEKNICILANESFLYKEAGICIYGLQIEREYYRRFGIQPMEKGYIPSEIGTPSEDCFNLLLAHNPDYYPQYAEWGADLTLSGHVHGGVLRIPFGGRGVLSPNVRFFPKYEGGIFELPRGEDQETLKKVSRKWQKGVVNPKEKGEKTPIRINAGESSILLVSRGMGNHSVPFRFCNPAELVVVDFLPDNG